MKYNLEEWLDDPDFISYVMHGTKRTEWEEFFSSTADLKIKALKARKIIEILHDSFEDLSDKEILDLWQNIDRFDTLASRKRNRKFIYSIVRYAAVIMLLISAGITGWLYFGQGNETEPFRFSNTQDVPEGDEARLILHSGEEIALQRDNSSIKIRDTGEIEIDDEQVIRLKEDPQPGSTAMNEVVVPYGKKSQLLLADGTKVWLNAGSRLGFPSEFPGKKREVYLEGEAYFEVAGSESQPFVVKAREIAVRVLGTRFNISAYSTDQTIETVLLEGSISLSDNESGIFTRKETVLSPNHKASFGKANRQFKVDRVADAGFYIAWTSGWFMFAQESLQSVLHKLERYYNVEFLLERSFPAADLISGKLDLKDSLDQVMMALADVSGIEYRISGGKVIITKPIEKIPMRR